MSESPPNIIFIMSDDHAAHAMSCYTKRMEGRPIINITPNIDRIAKEGVIFDNCFCTNSICTPSRASIMTGLYSHKTGVTTLSTHLNNQIPTFVHHLNRAGYQTAMVGKWHLGHSRRYQPRYFDYFKILPGQGFYRNPTMIENGWPKWMRGYVTDIITDTSLRWLVDRDKSRPFLLMCHHKAPHRPWIPHKKYKTFYEGEDIPFPETFNDDYSDRADAAKHAHMRIENALNSSDIKVKSSLLKRYSSLSMPKNTDGYVLETQKGEKKRFKSTQDLKNWKYQRYIKDYLRCIASVDENVGKILTYLDQENLTENTIIIYTSDQGFFLGDHGWYDKRFMYEESLRMPFVMRFPKEIDPDQINKDIILNVDFAQTFLDYAGVEAPSYMQGRSFRPLTHGHTPEDWRDAFYYRYWVNGTFHKVYAHYGIRTLQHKLIYYYCDPLGLKGASEDPHEPEWELFDLESDPFEMHNVYNDPRYQETIETLKEKLNTLQTELGDEPYEEKKAKS